MIDSLCYTYTYGYAVVQAAKQAEEGRSYEEILAYLDDYFSRAETYFSVYNLDFAKKSGRISVAAAFVGDMLGLRPIMSIIDGEIKIIEKVRGDKAVVPNWRRLPKSGAVANIHRSLPFGLAGTKWGKNWKKYW